MFVQRLGCDNQLNHEYIDALIDVIKRNDGSCDEVWLASQYGYPSIEKHRECAEKLKYAAKRFREEGIEVSLQISNTLGHGEFMLSRDCSGLVFEGSPVTHMMSADGTAAGCSFCWNDEYFRNYIKESMLAYADLHPNYIWIDDDLRLFNHKSVELGCFCDNCIKKFNEENGTSFTREEIAEGMKKDTRLRRKYFEFSKNNLSDFVYDIVKTFSERSPITKIGCQYGDTRHELTVGWNFIFDRMREASGKPVAVRPGAGAYDDHNPNGILNKASYLAFLSSRLPEHVEIICPEIENTPDVVFGKTPQGTCFEASLNFANGCNAISYAMIMNSYEPLSYHENFFRMFSGCRKYWDKLISLNKDTFQSGLNAVYADNTIDKYEKESSWDYSFPVTRRYDALWRTALPIAFNGRKDKSSEKVYILDRENAENLTDEHIELLKKQNVILDADTFALLNKNGKISDTAVSPIDSFVCRRLQNYFADSDICKDARGKRFPDARFEPEYSCLTGGDIEVISVFKECAGTSVKEFGISEGIIKTVSGGRWAVLGVNLWSPVISLDRRNFILNIAEYLSDSSIKAKLVSPVQGIILPRENKEGKITSCTVVNPTIGDSGKLVLQIKNPAAERFSCISQYGEQKNLPFTKENNIYNITLPSVKAWNMCTVYTD